VAGSDAGGVGGRGRPSSLRLQHVALNVGELQACERFYRETLGLEVVWRPDADNVYLSNGSDNLALHRDPRARAPVAQSLDHIGFAVSDESAVDAWHDHLAARGVPIVAPPRTHRDGTRSLYCKDPEGNTVQLLYEPRPATGRERIRRGPRGRTPPRTR
jgi:catechol 2,3-dioxygenase-like lactoylglutathione lyase family enzyme